MLQVTSHKSQVFNKYSKFLLFTCVVCLVTCVFSGCTQIKQLQHLDQLLTLQDLSREKEAQGKAVETNDVRYQQLRIAIKDGTIKNYPDRKSIETAFGHPIIIMPYEKDDTTVWQQFLYRRAIGFNNSDKVYLYFDKSGALVFFESLP